MALLRYVKAAFLNRWNLLAFGAGSVFAFITGRPDVVLPLVLAGEVGYLGLLSAHDKFQRAVDAAEHKARREESLSASLETFRKMSEALPPETVDRYEALRERCRSLRQIAVDLHRADAATGAPLDQMQTAGFDRLLWSFLRLLYTEWSLRRFFETTGEKGIEEDIRRLDAKVRELRILEASPGRDKALKAVEDNLATSRARLANLGKARENHELIKLEIDRLENKIRSISEMAVNRQESDFISDQVDAVSSSMVETERTMNELQFATGFTSADEAVPALLEGPPVAPEAEVETESVFGAPPRRRFRR